MGDLTNFNNGITSFGVPVFGSIGFPTQGNVYFVKPYSGSDSNDGSSPSTALKTLSRAHTLATANQNDIVYLMAESNTAASTTDYQSSTLTWSKDMVHLIGVCSPSLFSNRARVAFTSTYDTASNLITVSSDGCIFSNIAFFAGVAGTNPTGCMKITGTKNYFSNCHIAGIGHDNNDIAGAYSLWFYDASENVYDNCTIGIDTIGRGSAANHEILFTTAGTGSASARNVFKNCRIIGYCASAGDYLFLKANVSGAFDRFILFDNCIFHNPAAASGGATMTQAFQIHASAGGNVILHNTTIVGAGNVNASDTGLVLVGSGGLAADTEATDLGLAVVTTNA